MSSIDSIRWKTDVDGRQMTHSARQCLLLINPNARSGDKAQDLAENALREAGFEISMPSAMSPEQSQQIIKETNADLIVLGGGDGTIGAAAPALLAAGKTVGILPLGTANDLAGSLGIPKRLDLAVQVIANGEARAIDVGLVNGRPFFNAVTIGLGVDVIRSHSGVMKKRLGVFNYPRVILKSMRERRYFRARLTVDGQSKSANLLHIGIANGRYHGGGLPAHMDATIDDGILHLYAVHRATPVRYARALPALLMGRDGDDLLRMAGREMMVETDDALAISADGEEISTTPLRLSCMPGAITIMVPSTGIAGRRSG